MTVQLSSEARARVDGHLDAVEGVLVEAGKTREQRRAVMDDLEAQILEMLAAKSEVPGVAEVEGVLGRLDPPGAYGGGERPATSAPAAGGAVAGISTPVRAWYSRTAIWGLVCILASVLPLPVLLLVGMFFWHSNARSSASSDMRPMLVQELARVSRDHVAPSVTGVSMGPAERVALTRSSSTRVSGEALAVEPRGATQPTPFREVHQFHSSEPSFLASSAKFVVCIGVVIGPLGLLGTILGWMALAQIRRSDGVIIGKGMALFDGLFYPVLVPLLGLALLA